MYYMNLVTLRIKLFFFSLSVMTSLCLERHYKFIHRTVIFPFFHQNYIGLSDFLLKRLPEFLVSRK